MPSFPTSGRLALAAITLALGSAAANAGGGYFVLGYGPLAHQSGGVGTATGFDGFAAAANPAKVVRAGNRVDLGLVTFSPYRRVERRDSGTIYDFDSVSKNSAFFLPEAGMARRIDARWSWGVSLYGNGGLNTDYRDDTGVPGSSFNPARCGNRPSNFLFGCGNLGFDISQAIVAPTLGFSITPRHSIGIAALLGYQRFKAYGLQAFEGVSRAPDKVTNNDYDDSFGGGVRVGWLGQFTDWLRIGAAYSTKIYMQPFDEYEGLLADRGKFDIPASYSAGFEFTAVPRWTLAGEVQRIEFGEIRALGNRGLNSLQDPVNLPLGSKNGSGFNWRNQMNFRASLAWAASERLTLRTGYAYGRRGQRDASADSVTFNMLAPNPLRNVTLGFTWKWDADNDLHVAIGKYLESSYEGPSASAGLGVGGTEKVTPNVTTLMVAWSWR